MHVEFLLASAYVTACVYAVDELVFWTLSGYGLRIFLTTSYLVQRYLIWLTLKYESAPGLMESEG